MSSKNYHEFSLLRDRHLGRTQAYTCLCRTFPLEHFDFIHIRTLGGSIKDWPALLRKAYQHLKPGGKIEVTEGRTTLWCNDNTFPPDCAFQQWLDGFNRYGAMAGIEFDVIPKVPAWLEKTGFVGIQTLDCPVPVGTWPKEPALKKVGAIFRAQLYHAFEAYAMALFLRFGGWSPEEFQVLVAKARGETATNEQHTYTFLSVRLFGEQTGMTDNFIGLL